MGNKRSHFSVFICVVFLTAAAGRGEGTREETNRNCCVLPSGGHDRNKNLMINESNSSVFLCQMFSPKGTGRKTTC